MAAFLSKANDSPDASPVDGSAPTVNPLVLVIEDHDDTRFLLKYLLGVRGFRVVEAADGEEAICIAESNCPDLILMDISLPRLDGLAATRRMRGIATLYDVPIVYLSGHAEPAFRGAALATGGNDFLVKPLDIGELERVLDRHLGKSRSRQSM